jgi:hypothetical protein
VRETLSVNRMKIKTVYLILCVVGVALPYWQFLPWIAAHGFNMPLFLRELFANRIGGFFGMDVLVSAIVLLVFAATEGRRIGVRGRWLVVVAVCAVGVAGLAAVPVHAGTSRRTECVQYRRWLTAITRRVGELPLAAP